MWRPARLFHTFSSAINAGASVWIFGLMFVIAVDVIGRNIFDHPFRGVFEIVGYSIAGCVFLQLAHTLHVGRFTQTEILVNMLSRGRRHLVGVHGALFCLVGALAFGAILYSVWPGFVKAWTTDEVVGTPQEFTFTIWPFRLVLVIGAAATTVEFLLQAWRHVLDVAAVVADPAEGGTAKRAVSVAALTLAAIAAVLYALFDADISNAQIGMLSILGMLILILSGMHIGTALITLSFLGLWLMRGDPLLSFRTLSLASNSFLVSYLFAVIPLFVIMGLLVSISDIGKDTFDVARVLMRRVKGGLGVATVAANAFFAAITGTSIASASLFAKIASPEMMRHGYTVRFSVGVVAGSSVLGMLIPPSILLIIYGFLAEVSVGILFTAAIIPGIVLSCAFGIAIVAMAHFWPSYVGHVDHDRDAQSMSAGQGFIKILPILLLIVAVLGGIYGGIVTPTEAGAVGAIGGLVVTFLKGRLNWANMFKVAIEAGHVTVSILFLILAANIYSIMLARSGLPQILGNAIIDQNLGFYGFIALYVLLLVLLGMVLDSVSIMLIVLPLMLPVMEHLGGDPIWFGILTVVAVEIGLLTPPLGLTCFVVKSTLDDPRISLKEIFIGAFPFVIIMLAVVGLIVAFPQLALMLI